MSAGYERVGVLEALTKVGAFKDVRKQALGLIADSLRARNTIKAGQTLCVEGDTPDVWWIVLDGTATVSAKGSTVGVVGADDTVGELSLFDGGNRSATITADTDLEVLTFDGSSFVEAVEMIPDLALNLLRTAARRLRAANELA